VYLTYISHQRLSPRVAAATDPECAGRWALTLTLPFELHWQIAPPAFLTSERPSQRSTAGKEPRMILSLSLSLLGIIATTLAEQLTAEKGYGDDNGGLVGKTILWQFKGSPLIFQLAAHGRDAWLGAIGELEGKWLKGVWTRRVFFVSWGRSEERLLSCITHSVSVRVQQGDNNATAHFHTRKRSMQILQLSV